MTDSLPAHMLRYYTENVQCVIPLRVYKWGLGRNKCNLQFHLRVPRTNPIFFYLNKEEIANFVEKCPKRIRVK